VKTKVERAAVDLFAANGFDGVSIADIAGAAGVSQGALYRHYASKEELGWALLSDTRRRSRVRGCGGGNDRAFLRAL
jgi:AcrR family transcriptional regulator